MNPFSLIEKWITEHGSAAALRDHVALLKERMTSLENDNRSLKAERDVAQSEAKQLQEQIGKYSRRKKYGSSPDGKLHEIHSEQPAGERTS